MDSCPHPALWATLSQRERGLRGQTTRSLEAEALLPVAWRRRMSDYRSAFWRADTKLIVGRFFGRDGVFMDISNIPHDMNWRLRILDDLKSQFC